MEILQIILDYLDERSRFSARLTNTDWLKSINIDVFTFYNTTKEQLPAVIKRVSEYLHPIGITFKKSRIAPSWRAAPEEVDEFLKLSILTNLTRLSIPDQEFEWPVRARWMRLTTLTNLQVLDIKDKHLMPYRSLLPSFPNIVSINIHDNIALAQQVLSLTNLRHLEFFPVPFIKLLPELICPEKLTSLTINDVGHETMKIEDDIMALLTGLKRFVCLNPRQAFPQRLLPNLESLEVGKLSDGINMNTKLTYLKFADPSRTTELTSLTNLRALSINYGPNKYIEAPSFMTALTALENLKFFGFYLAIDLDLISQYFASSKLTQLKLKAARVTVSPEISRLITLERLHIYNGSHFGWLTHLTNLTFLKSFYHAPEDAKYLTRLTTLKALIISTTEHEGDLNLLDLTHLERLQLLTKFINDGIIRGIESLTRLTSLSLAMNVDIDVQFWTKLTHLKALRIHSRNSLGFWNKSIITALTSLRKLIIVDPIDDDQALMLLPLTQLTRLGLPFGVTNEAKKKFNHIYQLK